MNDPVDNGPTESVRHRRVEPMTNEALEIAKGSLGTRGVGVFADNRNRPIHRWYPFVEGYSSALVARAISSANDPSVIFDPFGGSGTTALTASIMGLDSAFTEANPYMSWVADVKVNATRLAALDSKTVDALRKFANEFESISVKPRNLGHPLLLADGSRDFFPPGVAGWIVATLEAIDGRIDGPAAQLARLAVATSIVPASNMLRRTDLRRRRDGEPVPVRLTTIVPKSLRMIASDIESDGHTLLGSTSQLGVDAKASYESPKPLTLIITSPPYLNGTNYGRNTKLELLAMGFLGAEAELEGLRGREITAGINNVAKRTATPLIFESVEAVAEAVVDKTYDRRIPMMIRAYFSEMYAVFVTLAAQASPNAEFWLDIGDSRYSGVHVRTHDLLCEVASMAGWTMQRTEVIRERRSYDGGRLSQSLIQFSREA